MSEQLVTVNIGKPELEEAHYMSKSFVSTDVKNRVFLNTLASETMIKYLKSEKIIENEIFNLHTISKIVEEFEVADVQLDNIHIDCRVVFGDEKLLIPLTPKNYGITPDIYVFMSVDSSYEKFKLLGYIEAKDVDFTQGNSQYCFVNIEQLKSIDTILDCIKENKRDLKELTEEEFFNARKLSVDLSDHNITDEDKKVLFNALLVNASLRESIIEFDSFETLSYNVVKELVTNPIPLNNAGTEQASADTSEEVPAAVEEAVALDEPVEELSEELVLDEELIEDLPELSEPIEELAEEDLEASEEDTTEKEETKEEDNKKEEEEKAKEDKKEDDDKLLTVAEGAVTAMVASEAMSSVMERAEDLSVDELTSMITDEAIRLASLSADKINQPVDFGNLAQQEREIPDLTKDEVTVDLSKIQVVNSTEFVENPEVVVNVEDLQKEKVFDLEKDMEQVADVEYAISGDQHLVDMDMSSAMVIEDESASNDSVSKEEPQPVVSMEDLANNSEALLDDLALDDTAILDELSLQEEVSTPVEQVSDLAEEFPTEDNVNALDDLTEEVQAPIEDLETVELSDDLQLDEDLSLGLDTLEMSEDISADLGDSAIPEENFSLDESLEMDIDLSQEELGDIETEPELSIAEESVEIPEPEVQAPVEEVFTEPEAVQVEESLDSIEELLPTEDDVSILDELSEEVQTPVEDLDSIGITEDLPQDISDNTVQDMPQDDLSIIEESLDDLQEVSDVADLSEVVQETPQDTFSEVEADAPQEVMDDLSALDDLLVDEAPTDVQNAENTLDMLADSTEVPTETAGTVEEVASTDDWLAEMSMETEEPAQAEEDLSFLDGFEIAEEPQASANVVENSSVISSQNMHSGEIPIDINYTRTSGVPQPNVSLEKLYNESPDDMLLQSSQDIGVIGRKQPSGGGGLAKLFGFVLVLAVLGGIGFGIKTFKASDSATKPIENAENTEEATSSDGIVAPSDDDINQDNVIAMDEKTKSDNMSININKPQTMKPSTNVMANTQPIKTIGATSFINVSKLSWQIPTYVSQNANFRQYLQSVSKSLKLSLNSDLLLANDAIHSNEMRVSITYDKDGNFKVANIINTSNSSQIDKIVLQTVNQTLKVLKAPRSANSYETTTVILKINF